MMVNMFVDAIAYQRFPLPQLTLGLLFTCNVLILFLIVKFNWLECFSWKSTVIAMLLCL